MNSRVPALARWLVIPFWALLFVGTHLPPSKLPIRPRHVSDKVQHFCSYGILTGLLLLALGSGVNGQRSSNGTGVSLALLALLGVAGYGLFDEMTQPAFGRSFEWLDWCANIAGALFALGLVLGLRMLPGRATSP